MSYTSKKKLNEYVTLADIYRKIVITKTRPSLVDSTTCLSKDAERNEVFAKMIADEFGLIYVEQAFLATNDENKLLLLFKAKDILSQFMSVGERVRQTCTPDDNYRWIFTFQSNP